MISIVQYNATKRLIVPLPTYSECFTCLKYYTSISQMSTFLGNQAKKLIINYDYVDSDYYSQTNHFLQETGAETGRTILKYGC